MEEKQRELLQDFGRIAFINTGEAVSSEQFERILETHSESDTEKRAVKVMELNNTLIAEAEVTLAAADNIPRSVIETNPEITALFQEALAESEKKWEQNVKQYIQIASGEAPTAPKKNRPPKQRQMI